MKFRRLPMNSVCVCVCVCLCVGLSVNLVKFVVTDISRNTGDMEEINRNDTEINKAEILSTT
jgi:hypothetical protein